MNKVTCVRSVAAYAGRILKGEKAPSTFAFVLSDMREHVLLFCFCLLGLVLAATIILVIAPGAVTWALALIE